MLEWIWGFCEPLPLAISFSFPHWLRSQPGATGEKVTWTAWKSFPSSKINFLTRHFLPIPLRALWKDFNPCGEVRPKR